jgi:serine/threonine protein kinase
MSIDAGSQLGRYEIRSKLGAGGMGEVFLATDTKLGRDVALKVLPIEVATDRNRMARFVQEAKAASGLNHPNILTIYEIDEVNSVHFISSELIHGDTLRELLKNRTFAIPEVLDLAVQIVNALVAAHGAGIIHRDLKPENIMLRLSSLDLLLPTISILKRLPVLKRVPARLSVLRSICRRNKFENANLMRAPMFLVLVWSSTKS